MVLSYCANTCTYLLASYVGLLSSRVTLRRLQSHNLHICSIAILHMTYPSPANEAKPSLQRTAFRPPESVAVLEAFGWISAKVKVQQRILEQLIRVTYLHCFLTGGPYIIYAVPEAIYVVIILSDSCRLPLPHRLAYRINLAHSSDFPPAWLNSSGKWQHSFQMKRLVYHSLKQTIPLFLLCVEH
jgi:hypothetical protein